MCLSSIGLRIKIIINSVCYEIGVIVFRMAFLDPVVDEPFSRLNERPY